MADLDQDSSKAWQLPRARAILERPEDTPIDISKLTDAEVNALFLEAKGMWADHPEIKDPVKWVTELSQGLSRTFLEKNG